MNNVAFGGNDPERHRNFAYYETIGGGHGAGPVGDGISGRHSHMTNTRNTPVEAIAHELPLRVVRYRLRRGSGGAGRSPGGDGIERVIEVRAPAVLSVLSERHRTAPYGLAGGGAAASAAIRVERWPSEAAVREGCDLKYLTTPLEMIAGSDGRVAKLKCCSNELGEPDASGRRRPVPIEEHYHALPLLKEVKR